MGGYFVMVGLVFWLMVAEEIGLDFRLDWIGLDGTVRMRR